MLLTQEEIKTILQKTLPKLSEKDAEAAASALVKDVSEWKEVDLPGHLGAELSVQCRDICALGAAYEEGDRIRAFIRKKPASQKP